MLFINEGFGGAEIGNPNAFDDGGKDDSDVCVFGIKRFAGNNGLLFMGAGEIGTFGSGDGK